MPARLRWGRPRRIGIAGAVGAIGQQIERGKKLDVPAAYDGRVLYEGELAVVIGRTAQAVSLADAPAHIFGYTLANDVTALELLLP